VIQPPSQTQQIKPQVTRSSSTKRDDDYSAPEKVPIASSDSKESSAASQEERSYADHMMDSENNMTQSHLNSLFNGHLMKWKFEAEEGTIFLRVPAFLGAVAQVAVTIVAFFVDQENALQTHSIVLYLCIIFMAGLVMILDGRWMSSHPLSVRSHLRNIITRNFNILRFMWGRGLLYITVGVLTLAQMWQWAIYAGSFMCVVGVLSVGVGIHASRKFAALRNSLADESFLLLVFANYDHDGDGFVDPREFSMILMDLGVELDDRYTLKAFNTIDQEGNRRISFEEFSHWWSSGFVERGRKHWSEGSEDEYAYRRMGDANV